MIEYFSVKKSLIIGIGLGLFSLPSIAEQTADLTKTTSAKAVLDIDYLPQQPESFVWSPVFQSAWNNLNKELGGKPLSIKPANALMDKLDHSSLDLKTIIPHDVFASFSGKSNKALFIAAEKGFKQKLNLEWKLSKKVPVLGGISAFSALKCHLEFNKAFFNSKGKFMTFTDVNGQTKRVSFFGCEGEQSTYYRPFVKVLHYENNSSYALEIKSKRPKETVVLFMPSTALPLRKAIEQVKGFHNNPLTGKFYEESDPQLHEGDVFISPILSLKCRTNYIKELKGDRYYKNITEPFRIDTAVDHCEFQLNAGGATVSYRSEVSGILGSPVPRQFLFTKPFYVFLWKKNAEAPYFAAWIGDTSAMQLKK